MQRLKFLFTLLVLICGTLIASAQSPADALLDNLSRKMKNAKGLKASFELKIKMPNGKVKETRNGIMYSKGSSFNVSMGDNEIICDGSTLWNYNKKMKEVQINEYDEEETTISPQKLFSSSFKKDYNYSYAGMRVMNQKTYKVVRLIPKDKSGQFTKVELLIRPTTGLVYRGYLTDSGKNLYVYTVKSIDLNQNLPASKFTFDQDAHPGVQVLDLR